MRKERWARATTLLAATAMIGSTFSSSVHAANIVVEYSGTDPVGREIAYELREKIAASKQHELVHSRDDAGFRVILVTVGSDSQITTAYSAVLVWKNYAVDGGLDYFVTTFAGNCGRDVAARCAANVLSGMDVEISGIVSAVLGAVKK